MTPCLVWCSIDTPDNAQKLAQHLVNARLAACVSVLPQISATYVWQGQTQSAQECLLLIKSSAERFEALSAAIVAQHPYDVPEILMQPISAGHPPYLAWMAQGLTP